MPSAKDEAARPRAVRTFGARRGIGSRPRVLLACNVAGVACALLGCNAAVFIRSSTGFVGDDGSSQTSVSWKASFALAPFAERTPFLVTMVVYAMQTFLMVFSLWTAWARSFHHGAMAPQLAQVERSSWTYLWVSTAGFLTYAYWTFGPGTILLVQSPAGGIHYGLRNILWLVTTPCQWYAFGKACTVASPGEVAGVLSSTIVMQVFGLAMLVMPSHLLSLVCFMIGCTAFLRMFRGSFRFKIVKEFEFLSRRILYVDLGLWIMYPIACSLRMMGWIDAWTEQVLIYSVLDICTKTVTFSTILMAHFYIVVTEANAALEVINAANVQIG